MNESRLTVNSVSNDYPEFDQTLYDELNRIETTSFKEATTQTQTSYISVNHLPLESFQVQDWFERLSLIASINGWNLYPYLDSNTGEQFIKVEPASEVGYCEVMKNKEQYEEMVRRHGMLSDKSMYK